MLSIIVEAKMLPNEIEKFMIDTIEAILSAIVPDSVENAGH
jgi:hypothetical protein